MPHYHTQRDHTPHTIINVNDKRAGAQVSQREREQCRTKKSLGIIKSQKGAVPL